MTVSREKKKKGKRKRNRNFVTRSMQEKVKKE